MYHPCLVSDQDTESQPGALSCPGPGSELTRAYPLHENVTRGKYTICKYVKYLEHQEKSRWCRGVSKRDLVDILGPSSILCRVGWDEATASVFPSLGICPQQTATLESGDASPCLEDSDQGRVYVRTTNRERVLRGDSG